MNEERRSGDAEVESVEPQRARWATRTLMTFAALALFVVSLATYVYLPRVFYEETDDAYIHADIVALVPKVAAYVATLYITDNSRFRKGDQLIQLDPRDFENAVKTAEADLALAKANRDDTQSMLAEQTEVIDSAAAAVAGDRATSAFAEQQLTRYSTLAESGSGTQQRMQQAQSDRGQHDANLRRDSATLSQAHLHRRTLETQLQEREASIAAAEAALAQARLNLSYTRLFAVADGSVASRNVEAGNFVQPGQVLLSAVPDDVYIFANYKETQIYRMRVGQKVLVHVDALPGLTLHAHIDSFQRGTGSTFALLPPENATGNFVKVVQRIPIKIRFDEPEATIRRVSPGMSVETTVEIHAPPSWLSWLSDAA